MSDYLMQHDGSRFLIRPPTGADVDIEMTLPPGTNGPPEHAHASMDETYAVLEGQLELCLDGAWQTVGPGGRLTVPKRTAHTFRNRGAVSARFVTRHTPALRFAEYMHEMGRLSREGHLRRGPRALIPLSMLWNRYPDCFRATNPGQRLVMNLLAWLGKRIPAFRQV